MVGRRKGRSGAAVTAALGVVVAAVSGWWVPAAAARPVAAAARPVAAAARPVRAAKAPTSFPAAPPAAICDSPGLNGPASAPPGAVVVKAGDDSTINWNRAGVTFWFAPGTHTLGNRAAGIIPANNTSFIGAPGAILDGKGVNTYAFGKLATGVTISYLTIQGFNPPRNEGAINHETSSGWTVQHDTVQNNLGGAGVMLGPNAVVSFNCLRNNGQYGYSSFAKQGDFNITLDHNEVAGNNTADWETVMPGCGCSGAGKIWNTTGGSITDNWIHNNKGPGIWVDADNAGLLIDGNYVNDNDAEGIIYEISYNGRITNNNLRHNGFVEGHSFAAQHTDFPVAAIYIAGSGGDSRVDGGLYATFDISGNNLDNNWGGVTLFENADRFCGSDSFTLCTRVNPQANLKTCVPGQISSAPYFSDCRWKTQNVSVHDNQLVVSRADIGCTAPGCGFEALIGGTGTSPPWSPYLGTGVDTAVTTTQNNHFSNNSYIGDWQFMDFTSTALTLNAFQSPPISQDAGSSLTPLSPGNLLDADTANAEGSTGMWVPWFSAQVTSSTAEAHGGSRSLGVTVTAPFGWGVQPVNWPGFAAGPGPRTISFWGLLGSANGALGATMQVNWRGPGGTVLQTDDTSIATLSSQWQQGAATAVAPAGTVTATVEITGTSGIAGDSLFLDQIYVGTPPTSTNFVDADTASLEGSIGHWVAGPGAAVSQSGAAAQSGSFSLQVQVAAAGGWQLQLGSGTAFPASAGTRAISFWGSQPTGSDGVTMSVDWHAAGGAILHTDTVNLAGLGPAWQEAGNRVVAPAGTASVTVELHGTGAVGDTVYLDQIYVGAPVNLLDPDTAGLEGSVGKWVPWFSSSVAQSTAAAEAGTHSLLVTVTAPFGWGVQLGNPPGFPAASGVQVIGFWGLQGSAPLGVTMTVDWRDPAGKVLQSNTVAIATLSTTWQQASATVSAPAGTAFVSVELTSSAGGPGDFLYLDEVHIGS